MRSRLLWDFFTLTLGARRQSTINFKVPSKIYFDPQAIYSEKLILSKDIFIYIRIQNFNKHLWEKFTKHILWQEKNNSKKE